MRRLPSGARTLTAVIAALLVLSVVLGDTQEVGAARAALVAPSAFPSSPVCGGTSATRVGCRVDQPASAPTTFHQRATSNSHSLSRAIAGIPPWVIWPPSPMPRIAGTLVRRPALNALVGIPPSALQAGWTPTSTLPPATIAENSWLNLRVPSPPARLAGADHSIPRPPPPLGDPLR